MTARSIPRMACNARRLSLGASGGVYALPGAYGNLAAGPNTWQCASHAAGGNVNRGCGTAKDCRIRPRMPSTELPGERALEARTMRRVAVRVVPFLMVCYFVSFLDRVNLGFAALQMVRDLHFSATVFGLGGGIFFVSYFFSEVPSNLLLEKFGARRWIARIMITWGMLAGAMALVKGPQSLYLMRLLLGAAEAGFFPGVILYLTYWFPAEHRARIVGLFMVAIPVSSFVGSPISAALLETDGWLGLRGWQWMFIVEALPAVLLGLACLFVLSDRPADARWLGSDERNWLLARLQAEDRRGKPVRRMSVWQVLWNKHVLVLSVVLAGSTAVSSGLQLWQPQIIKSYGLTNMQTGLLNAIPFALASLIMVWWARRSDRTGERIWHASLPLMLTAVSLASALVLGSLFSIVV